MPKPRVCICPTPPRPDDSEWVRQHWLHRSDCPANYDEHARMNPPDREADDAQER